MLSLVFLGVGILLLLISVRKHLVSQGSSKNAKRSAPETQATSSGLKPLTILFGTQSGTAQAFAGELAAESRRFGFEARVSEMDSFDMDQLQFQEMVVLLVATYGEGDPPDSALEFDQWLMSDDRVEDEELGTVKFAVFGLGNRQYEFFNRMGVKFDRRMQKLGAERVMDLGLGDDDGSLEDDWREWKGKFWGKLVDYFHGSDPKFQTQSAVENFNPSVRIIWGDGEVSSTINEENRILQLTGLLASGKSSRSDVESPAFYAPLSVSRELKKSQAEGSTLHMELDLKESGMTYQTADNLGIFPRNDHKLVALLGRRLRIGDRMDTAFRLKSLAAAKSEPLKNYYSSNSSFFNAFLSPRNECELWTTPRIALLHYCDLTSAPRKRTLEIFGQFASDESEQERLYFLASSSEEAKNEYHLLFNKYRLNLLEILTLFPSISIPFEVFLETCPPLQPRYYTIASSSLVHPDSIHIVVSMVSESLPDIAEPQYKCISGSRHFYGVCTRYLSQSRPMKDRIACIVRRSTFRLPKNLASPVIMIGPGTGIAPMRAFIQEGQYLKERGLQIQNWTLYFGCRNREVDFLYEHELLSAQAEGVLDRLVVAFSREQKEKIYVQHKVKEDSGLIWQLLELQNGSVYICGATSMGRDVREVMVDIFKQEGNLSQDQAVSYLRKLQNSSRFIQELWG